MFHSTAMMIIGRHDNVLNTNTTSSKMIKNSKAIKSHISKQKYLLVIQWHFFVCPSSVVTVSTGSLRFKRSVIILYVKVFK